MAIHTTVNGKVKGRDVLRRGNRAKLSPGQQGLPAGGWEEAVGGAEVGVGVPSRSREVE